MLTISVKNFGPIAEGSVDLKPLTIFVGPSNTGKSYMATAVYAVMQGFEGPSIWGYDVSQMKLPDGQRPLQWHAPSGRKLTARNGGGDAVAALIQWASGLHRDALNPREVYWHDLSNEVRSEMEHSTRLMLRSTILDVIEKIADTYGEPPNFVSIGAVGQDFSLNVRRVQPFLNFCVQLSEGTEQHLEFDLSGTPIAQPYLEAMLRREESNDRPDINRTSAAMLFLTFLDSAIEPIFTDFPPQSFYLPAARSGMVVGHKPLSASLIRNSTLMRTKVRTHGSLPATATDFLSQLVSLDRRMSTGRVDKGLVKAIDLIESHVLQGQVDIDDSGGLPLPDIVYLTATGGRSKSKFTLDQSSSMVSELAPLVLFLKYLIRPGHLLILEEPESHLHPAAQRQLARGIVRLVNAGVKVLVTTHSDIIISQINNLLALRQASPELVEQGGFEPEDFLQPDQVGTYLFRYNQELGGCETVELEIDPDTGIDEDQFAAVFEAIYDESIALQRDRN